jgi:hypothetical protein
VTDRRVTITAALVAALAGCQVIAGLRDRAVADAGADAATDGLTPCDEDAGAACPDDMVFVPPACVCIDQYEASRGDGGAASSVAGVMPWSDVTLAAASSACTLAGKRLCTSAEWRAACDGAPPQPYPYGHDYRPDACNGRDHVPDGGSGLLPTGGMPECEGGYPGLFDMSGNLAELTADSCTDGSCFAYGGTWDPGSEAFTLKCDSPSPCWHEPCSTHDWGFRCCRDP